MDAYGERSEIMKKMLMKLMTALVITVILQFGVTAADTYTFTANISGPANVTAGSEVTYAVSVTNIDAGGHGMIAADMTFSFNTAVFTYVSGSAAAVSPPAGWSAVIDEGSASTGAIRLSSTGTTPITADNAIKYQLKLFVKSTDKLSTELLLTGLAGTGPDAEEYNGTSAGHNVTIAPPLAISDQTLGGSLTVGEDYSAFIVTTGGTGAKEFTTDNDLPDNLNLDPDTGEISGIPSQSKATPTIITVKVTDEVETTGVSAEITIPLISKAESDFNKNAPTDLTATYGDILSSVVLPAGYTWTDGTVKVGDVGTKYFPAKYNPDPANNEDASGNIYVKVSAKLLKVDGATAVNRPFDGSKTVSLTAVALNGIVAGDTASDVSVDAGSAVGTLSSSNVGKYEKVNLTVLVLTGAKAGNYTVAKTADNVPVNVRQPPKTSCVL